MDPLALPNKFFHGDNALAEPFPPWSVPHAHRVQQIWRVKSKRGHRYNVDARNVPEHVHQKFLGLFKQFCPTVPAQWTAMVSRSRIFRLAPRAKTFVIRPGDFAFRWHTDQDTPTAVVLQDVLNLGSVCSFTFCFSWADVELWPVKTNAGSRPARKGARIPPSTSGWVRRVRLRLVLPNQNIPACAARSNRLADWKEWP